MDGIQQLWERGKVMAKCLWNDHGAGRMVQWAAFCAVLYVLILLHTWPLVVQVALTKAANVNAGAFVGYWVDRSLFNSFDNKFDKDPNAFSDQAKAMRVVARGLVVAACILGFSTGIGA